MQGLDTATPTLVLGPGNTHATAYEENLGTLMAFKPDAGAQLLGCTTTRLKVAPASSTQTAARTPQ